MITLAVDPGRHHAGWAIFIEKTLVRAGVVKVKPPRDEHGPEYRQHRMREVHTRSTIVIAEQICAHVEIARRIIGSNAPVEYVSECPQLYLDEERKLKNNVDPADLFAITLTSATIAGELRQPKRVRYVEPRPWKGNRSDAATWQWIRNCATPEEVAVLIQCGVYNEESGKGFHHGLEAFGIGAWSLFRI